MVSRKWKLHLLLLGPAFLVGCGPTVTYEVSNENVEERIITQEDMDVMQDQHKQLTELGARNLTPPPVGQANP